MPLPHRANPVIKTNWVGKKSEIVFHDDETEKRSYYEISVVGEILRVKFREEKQKDHNGDVYESHWFAGIEFNMNEKFARDPLMFLKDYVGGENEGEN